MNNYTLTSAQINCQKELNTTNKATIIKSIRSGKTLTVLDYIYKKKYTNILWITPYLTNITALKEEQDKWGFNFNIDATTFQSIKHHNKKKYDLIVIDECHRITEKSVDDITQIKYDNMICMTGTYPNKKSIKRILLEIVLGCKIVYEYTIDDAVNNKIVAPYNISIINKNLSEDLSINIKTNNHNFWTSELKNYKYLWEVIQKESNPKLKAFKYFNLLRFLNTLPSTIEFIKKYIKENENNNKRVLIFVATQEMAEKCSKYVFYGGSSDTYFKMFQNEEINHLVLVEKGILGITYKNLDGCLLTTINSSNASVSQKIFRTILWRPHYTADIKILINNNTEQEKWIKKALN